MRRGRKERDERGREATGPWPLSSILATWRSGVAALRTSVGVDAATPVDPRTRRRQLMLLGAMAVGPSLYKTIAIPTQAWQDWHAAAIAMPAVAFTFLALGGRQRPQARLRALGLSRLDAPAPPARWPMWSPLLWTLGPVAGVTAVSVVALLAGRPANESALVATVTLVGITAPAEELLFRGALLPLATAAMPASWASPVVAASFALWHVGNAIDRSAGESAPASVVAIVGTMLITAAGSYAFTWLRFRSRTLAGSVLGHVATNLGGTVLG